MWRKRELIKQQEFVFINLNYIHVVADQFLGLTAKVGRCEN